MSERQGQDGNATGRGGQPPSRRNLLGAQRAQGQPQQQTPTNATQPGTTQPPRPPQPTPPQPSSTSQPSPGPQEEIKEGKQEQPDSAEREEDEEHGEDWTRTVQTELKLKPRPQRFGQRLDVKNIQETMAAEIRHNPQIVRTLKTGFLVNLIRSGAIQMTPEIIAPMAPGALTELMSAITREIEALRASPAQQGSPSTSPEIAAHETALDDIVRTLPRMNPASVADLLLALDVNACGTVPASLMTLLPYDKLITLGRCCTTTTINNASSSGDAGRGTTLCSRFIKLLNTSGPCQAYLGGALNRTYGSAAANNVPAQPTLDIHELGALDPSARGKMVQDTIKCVVQMLRELVEDFARAPAPASLCMVVASTHAAARQKFTAQEALALAGGEIFLRVVCPLMYPPPKALADNQQAVALLKWVAKALMRICTGNAFADAKEEALQQLQPFLKDVQPALLEFVRRVILEGRMYCAFADSRQGVDVTDPADILHAALAHPPLMDALFAPPGEASPLGTAPARPSTPVGQLLAAVQRDPLLTFDEARRRADWATLVSNERVAFIKAALSRND